MSEPTASRPRSLLSQDRVWDRVRKVGLDELLRFDWALVGEADALGTEAADWPALDELDTAAVEGRLKWIREVIGDRRRYLEMPA